MEIRHIGGFMNLKQVKGLMQLEIENSRKMQYGFDDRSAGYADGLEATLEHVLELLNTIDECVIITKKEAKLIAALLEMAHDQFANHGCNDTPQEVLDAPGFTDEEKCTFHNEYEIYNSGDSEEIPHTVEEYNRLPDYALMGYFAAKLEGESR
jgi:hypothetical protein